MSTQFPDNRFATHKFGEGKFGPSTVVRDPLIYGVEVDWDGDGVFNGGNEAQYMTSYRIFRGRMKYLRPKGQGFEKLITGTATLVLRNTDGRYDAWNASSLLYPNVVPGREVRMRVRDLNSTTYALFYGVISDIIPDTKNLTVTIKVEDAWNYLRNQPARVALQTNVSPDTAMSLVLDSVSWPTRWGRALDASSDTIPYFWTTGDINAGDELSDLADSFVGYFFIDATGKATYIKRSNISGSVMDFPQELLLKDIGNSQPYEYNRNIVRFTVHPRIASPAGSVLYQLLGNVPSIGIGGTLILWTKYTYNGQTTPALSIKTPLAGTDYKMNTLADGSGTDVTANCSVVVVNLGDRSKTTIKNNSGVLVYLILMQLRGTAIFEQNTADVTSPADTASILMPREFVLDLRWQQNVNSAADFATVLGQFFSGNHPTPIIQVETRPVYQFTPDLFDIVTVDIPQLGISGMSFRVGGIEHVSDPSIETCQRIVTKFYLEPYVAAGNYMAWDINSNFDTQTVFGW